jgi:hypothetical protein
MAMKFCAIGVSAAVLGTGLFVAQNTSHADNDAPDLPVTPLRFVSAGYDRVLDPDEERGVERCLDGNANAGGRVPPGRVFIHDCKPKDLFQEWGQAGPEDYDSGNVIFNLANRRDGHRVLMCLENSNEPEVYMRDCDQSGGDVHQRWRYLGKWNVGVVGEKGTQTFSLLQNVGSGRCLRLTGLNSHDPIEALPCPPNDQEWKSFSAMRLDDHRGWVIWRHTRLDTLSAKIPLNFANPYNWPSHPGLLAYNVFISAIVIYVYYHVRIALQTGEWVWY